MSKKSSPKAKAAMELKDEATVNVAAVSWWRRLAGEPVALLLSAIILARPWCDGLTFPFRNAYFVWAIVLVVTVWGIGAVLRGEALRCGRPIALFAGFLLVTAVMGFNSIQGDTTYRHLLWWSGHLGVLLIATNALRTNLGVGIVTAAFCLSSLAEALFGFLHLMYILPFTRMIVNLDKSLISGLGATEQIQERLESNRAFGSFLFPNALAAFVILGIPYAVGAARRGMWQMREALASTPKTVEPSERAQRKLVSAAATVITWFAGFVAASLLVFLILSPYKYFSLQPVPGAAPSVSAAQPLMPVSDPFAAHWLAWTWWLGIAPLIPAVAVLLLTRAYSWNVAWPTIRLLCAVALGAVELLTLILTFSRGGTLGLIVASSATAFLIWLAHRNDSAGGLRGPLARILATASALLVFWAANHVSMTAYAQGAGAPKAGSSAINVEGHDQSVAKALDPTSARLRWSYWKTSGFMLKDYFLTGVGLGNYGTAYPVYQYLGSGDVKMAHNDFLQVWCETGIVGLFLFLAFWADFLLTGARRIVAEKNRGERWALAGLYAGVLAFLLHAVIDFNFQNTSLAFFVFLLAGLFYAHSENRRPQPAPRGWGRQAWMVLILAVAWIVAGAQARVRAVDNVVENRQKLASVLDTAYDFLKRAAPPAFDAKNPPRFSQVDVAELIPNLTDQQSFGRILIFESASSARYLKPGEPIPPTLKTKPFLEVSDPAGAVAKMMAAVDARIAYLEAVDASYPHTPMMAAALYQWSEFKVEYAKDKDEKARWILKALYWAEEGIRRTPKEYSFRGMLGRALFQRAGIEPNGTLAVETLQKGLDQFREGTRLYSTSQDMWAQYGDALEKAGAAFKKAGDAARGDAMLAEVQKAKAHAKDIKDYKDRTHTGATG